MVTLFSVMPSQVAHAELSGFFGGNEIAWQAFNVYDSSSFTNQIGSISKYEGFTVL